MVWRDLNPTPGHYLQDKKNWQTWRRQDMTGSVLPTSDIILWAEERHAMGHDWAQVLNRKTPSQDSNPGMPPGVILQAFRKNTFHLPALLRLTALPNFRYKPEDTAGNLYQKITHNLLHGCYLNILTVTDTGDMTDWKFTCNLWTLFCGHTYGGGQGRYYHGRDQTKWQGDIV